MAPLPILVHPDAVEEARQARVWYEARNPLAAEGFTQEIDRGMIEIAESPARWPEYILETRRFLLRKFPFLIVYRVEESMVQVIAIAHGRRKPGYWKVRTPSE